MHRGFESLGVTFVGRRSFTPEFAKRRGLMPPIDTVSHSLSPEHDTQCASSPHDVATADPVENPVGNNSLSPSQPWRECIYALTYIIVAYVCV